MTKYFFEIPIFRCSPNQTILEDRTELNGLIEYFKSANPGIEHDYEKLALSSMRLKASSYYYSELVGMIRLFSIPGQIRAELYFVKQKISRKLKKKTWELKSRKIFELWIHKSDTNENILKRLLVMIRGYHKESITISKFYVDLACFSRAGKFIDFLGLDKEIKEED